MSNTDRWIIPFIVDLENGAPLRRRPPQGIMLPGDSQAHTIQVTAYAGREPAALTGTPRGYFVREADGATVICAGSRSGNVARVTMAQACYAYPGPLRCVIRLENSGAPDVTLVDTTFYVEPGTGENIIDPGTPIHNVTELLEHLEDMETATANAKGAVSYIAQAYSASAIYTEGEYAIHDGKLYRCTTTMSSAETWTPAHWTQVNFGAELYDMDTSMHHHDLVFPRNGGRVAVAPATSGAIAVTVPRDLVRVRDRAAVNIDLGAADNAYTVPDGSALILTGDNTLVVGTLNAALLANNGNCILLYNDKGVPCGQLGGADKAEISALKSAIKAVNNTADITITQSTQYTEFEFEVGKRYTLYNGTNNSMNAHTMTAPSASGTAVEAIGTNILAGATVTFEPSTNASYARFYCNGLGTVTVLDISDGMPKLKADVAKLQEESTTYVQKNGKAQVTERNTTFFEQTSNLFDKDNVTEDYDIQQNGSGVYAATGYMATEYYIDVSEYNSIKPLIWIGSAVIDTSIRYVLYNANKVALNRRTTTNEAIDTSNATYLRFGAALGAKDTLMVVPGNINPTVYIPYGFKFKYGESQTVEINPTDDIIQKILDNKGKNIHFNAGTYNIISQYESHFGNDYFTNYTGYTSGGNDLGRGLPVYRGTRMTFSQGAVFTANYTGSNTAVRTNFSAFAIETGVEIDGLRLTTTGIRNCIHDDFDNAVSGETIIKNCHLTSDTNIIAGGLGEHDILIIKNCYFDRTNDTHQFDFSYHNNSATGAQSVVIIKDNYMRHGVSIRWYGASTLLTDVLISNNSMAYDVDYHEENASATIENINLKKWNNAIRNS